MTGGCLLEGVSIESVQSIVNRMTDRRKNITFPPLRLQTVTRRENTSTTPRSQSANRASS